MVRSNQAMKSYFIIGIFWGITLISSSQSIYHEEYVCRFISSYVERNNIPGLSVAIYKDDYIWYKGFGYSNLSHHNKTTANTIYNIGLITKSMTALAIVKLASEEKLNLNDEIQQYIPGFPIKKYPVTIRQLLGHFGGISSYKPGYPELTGIRDVFSTTEESTNIFKDWELAVVPGSGFLYSNYGYVLLGAAIEHVSGMSYGEYLKNEIWKPINMNRTFIDNPDHIVEDRASGYVYRNGNMFDFFCDYINLTSRNQELYGFSKLAEVKIRQWQRYWDKESASKLVDRFNSVHHDSIEVLPAFIKKLFDNKIVYPDLNYQINSKAYQLKGMGKVSTGLMLLEEAIELYPFVANLYDSAGEFCMVLGQNEKAIGYYKYALSIDPHIRSSKKALEFLETQPLKLIKK